MNETRKSWLSIAVLMLLLLVLAGLRPLALPDEGRYGDVGRWMLVSGDWLAPRLDGIPFFHKPPLLHWLQASTLQWFGVAPWSARLVPAAHAGLMLVALYLAGRQVAGEIVARRAVWMLGSSLAFLVGGQYINHDMLVACWIGLAIWCFAGALLSPPGEGRGLALAGFAACGLGVLAKGLIGLVLPGMVLFVWLFVARRWSRVLALPWVSGLLLLAAVALPWFVLAQQAFPGLFDYLIVGQHFRRYTGNTFNNQWGPWFYPVVLLGLLFPWAFLVLADGLRGLARQRLGVLRQQHAPAKALLWVWLVAITVFFSLPKSKLVGYILPVMPPLALLAAMAWQSRWGNGRQAGRVFVLLCAVNLGLGVAFNHLAGQHTLKKSSRDVAQVLACRMAPQDTVLVAGGYPYDLPFEANLHRPVVVVRDWAQARQTAGDNWERELFEGADFDAQAARVLQAPEVLSQTPPVGRWLVTPRGWPQPLPASWHAVYEGRAWTLWSSQDSAGESPEAAQDKGLACGDHHRR